MAFWQTGEAFKSRWLQSSVVLVARAGETDCFLALSFERGRMEPPEAALTAASEYEIRPRRSKRRVMEQEFYRARTQRAHKLDRRRGPFIRKRLLDATTVVVPSALALFLQPFPSPAQTPGQPPDTMAARVEACAPCHGDKGQGTGDVYFPRLAGKPAGYLYNQLVAFKNGRRKYPPMNYLLEFLTDRYLQDIADYFASEHPPPPAPELTSVSQQVLAQGETLVTSGDVAREIPACRSCHGPALTGMEPGIPGLLGLRPSYISAQLGAFRYGTRTAKAPDCMQTVAARLTEADVTAVAAWLASRPAPVNSPPAPKGAYALPFACGSEPD
jgi:cytochrome c553